MKGESLPDLNEGEGGTGSSKPGGKKLLEGNNHRAHIVGRDRAGDKGRGLPGEEGRDPPGEEERKDLFSSATGGGFRMKKKAMG